MYYYNRHVPNQVPNGKVPKDPKIGDVCSPIKIEWASRHSNQAILLLDNTHLSRISEETKATDKSDEFMVTATTVDFTLLFKSGNKVVISRPLAYTLPTQDRKSNARVEYSLEDAIMWQDSGNNFRKLFAGTREPINDEEVLVLSQYNAWVDDLKFEVYKYLVETEYTEELEGLKLSILPENIEETKAEYLKDAEDNKLAYVDDPDMLQSVTDFFALKLELLENEPEKWLIYDIIETKGNAVLGNYNNYTEEVIKEFFDNPYVCDVTGEEKVSVAWAVDLSYNFTGHRHPGSTKEAPRGSGFSGSAQHGDAGDFLIKYKETWNGTEWKETDAQILANDTGICYTATGTVEKTEGRIQDTYYCPAVMFQSLTGSPSQISIQAFTFSEYIPHPKDYAGYVYRNFGTTAYIIGNDVAPNPVSDVQKFLGVEVEQPVTQNYVQTVNGGEKTELSERIYDLFVTSPINVLYDLDATRFRYPSVAVRTVVTPIKKTPTVEGKQEVVGTSDKDYKIKYPKPKALKDFLRKNNKTTYYTVSLGALEDLFYKYISKEVFKGLPVGVQEYLTLKLFKVLSLYNVNLIQWANEFAKGKVTIEEIKGFTAFKHVTLPTFHRAKLKRIKWQDLVVTPVEDVHNFINGVADVTDLHLPLTQDKCKEALLDYREEFFEVELADAITTFKDTFKALTYTHDERTVSIFWDNAEKINLDVYKLLHMEEILDVFWDVYAWDFNSLPNKYLLERRDALEILTLTDVEYDIKMLSARLSTSTKISPIFITEKNALKHLECEIDNLPSSNELFNTIIADTMEKVPDIVISTLIGKVVLTKFPDILEEVALKGVTRIYELGIDFSKFIRETKDMSKAVLDMAELSPKQYIKVKRTYQFTHSYALIPAVISTVIKNEEEKVKSKDFTLDFNITELNSHINYSLEQTKQFLRDFDIKDYTYELNNIPYTIPINEHSYKSALLKFVLEELLSVRDKVQAENVISNINTLNLDVSDLSYLSQQDIDKLTEALVLYVPDGDLPMTSNNVHYIHNGYSFVATSEFGYKNECLALCRVDSIINYTKEESILLFTSGFLYKAKGVPSDFRVNEVIYT